MIFIAYLKGVEKHFECKKEIKMLESENKEEAIEVLKKIIIGEYDPEDGTYEGGYWDEDKLSSLTLYKVTEEEKIDVKSWYDEATAWLEAKKNEKQELKEKQEFERLEGKYGRK